ncbi:branched chain amino acid ABC transporter substrate-binding protein [Paractinoplanes deccanensis]|uniref:Branched chain amino acid ABC transporter substrate-binding protein n=1 Tax=Paractinoplanes deccanensis TaxID=113561 RepID=A0ABQ3YGZ8_9ACTN|nr:branched-chain amino acid ABC transporter substrate-binding protein [Actinoplanes deccanensis]GID79195.1 branched chain amino acid ABC transporter substrate-binding protein [Actinoplanes deccanensis]
MRQSLARAIGGVAMVGLLVGAAACASDDEGGSGSTDAAACGSKIAFFGALTGGNAQLGINIRDGAKLAVDQYNKANADCKVELVEKDSAGDPAQASGLATSIVQDAKVLGVVGPAFSGESKVANPILSKEGVVIITPSATNPALAAQGDKTFHRALGNDASQGPGLALYMKDVMKVQKAFVVDDASEYGKGLADQVKQTLGSVVTSSAVVKEQQTDFGALVTQINSSGADSIFWGGYYREAAPFLKQYRDAGGKAKFVAGDGVKDQAFVDGAGAANAEGAILTCPCVPPEKAGGTFAADYKAATGREAGTYSAEAFDAANILLQGIKAGNSTREKLETFVDGYTGQGVTTSFKFQENGEIDPSAVAIWAYKVQGGKIVADQEAPKS